MNLPASVTEVTISSIRQETPGVKTFILASSDGRTLSYAAGQFLTFVFTHHDREERRSFSTSSSPVLDEPLSVTIKRVDNGAYSRLLCDRAVPGDALYTTGAGGLFTLPEAFTQYKQVFFFAAGIGITPIYSLIKTLLHTQPDVLVVLVYSNRSRDEVVFLHELNALAEASVGRFRIEYLFSNSFNLARARLNKALVPVLLSEYSLVPAHQQLFYICGPFPYMRMVQWSLEENGIRSEQIRRENFNTSDRVAIQAVPPDKEPHYITLQHNNAETKFLCSYPDSILKAAKKNGIELPYSCETGRCGSCAAICTSGKVWLSYNEVLTDTDLKAGSILTCTGHPINGNVTIKV